METCKQCGYETVDFYEGYCKECCEQNQQELDDHNFQYDRWQKLSDKKRDDEIKNACK